MKRLISVVLILVCVLSIVGCNQKEKPQQENNKMQYYFTAKVRIYQNPLTNSDKYSII